METKEQLTNEKIRKRFVNQFELVNYAIKLAENMIRTGRDPRVKVDSHNRSLQVIGEIASGKDYLDEIFEEEETEVFKLQEPEVSLTEKAKERKKSRKALAE